MTVFAWRSYQVSVEHGSQKSKVSATDDLPMNSSFACSVRAGGGHEGGIHGADADPGAGVAHGAAGTGPGALQHPRPYCHTRP